MPWRRLLAACDQRDGVHAAMKRPCEIRPRGLAATVIAAILMLSACGGGVGSSTIGGEGATPPIPVPTPVPPSPPPHPLAKPLPVEIRVPYRSNGGRVGIGPAFASERPALDGLETSPVAGRLRSAPGAGETRWVGTAAPARRRWSVSSAPSRRTKNAKEGATWSLSISGRRKPFGSTALRLPRSAGRSWRHSAS